MNIERAKRLAHEKFAGVYDLQGEPYVGHLERVARYLPEGVSDEVKMIGWLHDVVEDTDITGEDLLKMGFSLVVVKGVLAVTRQEGESYAEFVIRASRDPNGRLVKWADLKDNSDPSRSVMRSGEEERDMRRQQKYLYSLEYIEGEISESEYRRRMDELGVD